MENNGMEELRMLVTRLVRLFDQQHGFNQDTNARFLAMAEHLEAMAERWDGMAARWDGHIVEQRQINERLASFIDEQRQMNERLMTILERLLPGSGNGRQEA